MANKAIIWGIAVIAIGSAVITDTIITNGQFRAIAANCQTVVNNNSFDQLPESLMEASNHPDKIITKDGTFSKQKETSASHNFRQVEIVDDSYNTNEKTKMIINNGDMYIKEE